MTGIDYPGSEPDVTFTYNDTGQRTGMTDGLGNTTWTYDNLDRLISVTDAFNKTIGYDYDAAGNHTELTYPDSKTVVYAYDDLNQLTGVTDWDTGQTGYGYDAVGRLASVSRPNGITSAYTYDNAGRLTALQHALNTETLASYNYTYDPAGNRTRAIETLVNPFAPPTPTPTYTQTETATETATNTPTDTPAATATDTATSTPTATATQTINSITIQPNVSVGLDAYISSANPTTKYGTANVMGIGEDNGATNITRSLIKFDLSAIPANATITSAVLSLWTSADFSSNDRTVRVYRLKAAWNESQVTWQKSSNGSSWQTAGASGANDRESTEIGSITILNNEALNAEKQISLNASKIQEMRNGTFTNNGFILVADTENNDRFDYKTSDNATSAHWPKLVVQYTLPPATNTPTFTPTFTPTATRTPTATATPSQTFTPTFTPLPGGTIFADGFESGDFTRWYWADTDGGDLSVSTQAAAVGNYGMQAVINDTTSLMVYDNSPVNQKHYSLRFYFNPNSVNIPNGQGVYLLYTGDNTSVVFCLYLEHIGESYLISLCGRNDSRTWMENDGIYINNAWTAVELEWQAASAAGANNGFVKLWLNDTLVDSMQNLDNDTMFIKNVSLGADTPPNGTSGTMYFDAFESRAGSHIGLDPNGPTLSPLPTFPDAIFADGFESGALSAWDWADTDGGNLSVTTQAAAFGNQGMQAFITDAGGMQAESSVINVLDESDPFYFNPDSANTPNGLENLLNGMTPMNVYDNTPRNEKHYSVRFYFDPNSVALADGQGMYLFSGSDEHWVICLYLERQGSSYRLSLCGMDDSSNWLENLYVNIADAWQAIEIEWQAATAPGANNGYMKLFVNDVLMDDFPNLDNDQRSITSVALGVDGIPTGTTGTVYFDAFESRRTSHIGLLAYTAPAVAQDQSLFQFVAYHPNATLPNPVLSAVEGLPPILNLPLQQQSTSLTIDYTYDALHRLTSAAYSDGRSFGYTYDAAGNVLQLEQNLGPGTVTTTYTYDAANQLDTAQVDGTTWQYTYDANGSLTEVLPNGNPASGAKRYTYNAAGNLVHVETHNGTGWGTQAEIDYNGLGQRLSMDAAGVIAHYVMDGDRPLTAETGGNTNFYLYGLSAIGEKTTAWNYSLYDGTNTPRQLSDGSGDITLLARYTPWGDTLDSYGTGNFTFGYFGGVMDAATGLLYVGNGQYYDPATGRFLTRDVAPNSTNPYVPWNPIGAIVGPLGAVALLFARRKKGSKVGTFLVLLLVLASVGMTLAACGPAPSPSPIPTNPAPQVPPTQTPIPTGPGTIPSDLPTSTPSPAIIIVVGDCPTSTSTIPVPIGTATPTPLDPVIESYGVKLIGDMASWTSARVTAVRDAVIEVANRMAQVAGGGLSALEVFRLVYEGINISWGYLNASETCLTIGVGGCTSGPHDINFVSLSDTSLKARNNVVHELGHAFSKFWSETPPNENEIAYARQHPEEVNPAIVLAWAHEYPGYTEHYIPGFRYRNTPPLGDTSLGNYYGFGSQQNDTSWQVAVTNAGTPSEEFADQFLGWTFDYWERTRDGSFSYEAAIRRNFMEKYMGGWIRYRIEH